MHEAWESESLSFCIVIIELSHSKEFWMAGTIQNSLEWPNPAGSTDCCAICEYFGNFFLLNV